MTRLPSATVRRATPADADAMLAVYAPYVHTPITFDIAPPTREEFAARMDDVMPAYPCLVLEHRGRVAGFAYAHAQAHRAAYRWNVELSVYLERGSTGHGWGRVLYDALLKLLRMQGFDSAYGLVTVPNEASERLHESLGFERSWVQPHAGWKNGAWHDVAWYVKTLAPFVDDPADPLPFDLFDRTHEGAQRIIDEANAALARHA